MDLLRRQDKKAITAPFDDELSTVRRVCSVFLSYENSMHHRAALLYTLIRFVH